MKAGKSSFLVTEVRRPEHESALVVGHSWDTRFDSHDVVQSLSTHDGICTPCQRGASWMDLHRLLQESENPSPIRVLFVDECQFFHLASKHPSEELQQLLEECRSRGVEKVFMAGLNRDWRGDPFEWIAAATAIAKAETLPLTHSRLYATCEQCGCVRASRSHLKQDPQGSRVHVGAGDMYLALCKSCFCEMKKNAP